MDCYHCGDRQARLKCADCDSQIFRFCSQQCGLEAHEEHKAVCYDRMNAEHLQEHLFDAIEGMHDPEEIDDALDVLVDLEDQHPETMLEAHEIIQSQLEFIGKLSETERAARDAKRAAKREESARKRQSIIDKKAAQRARKGESAVAKAQKRAARKRRRAEKKRRAAQAANRKADKYEEGAGKVLARGEQQRRRAEKPGLQERWHGWRKGHDEAAVEEYKGKAREGLQPTENP